MQMTISHCLTLFPSNQSIYEAVSGRRVDQPDLSPLKVDRPTRDQGREPRAAVAACASQVGQHHAAFALVAPRVVKPRQHAVDVRVALVLSPYTRGCERHLGRRLEEFLQLLDRAQPCLVHVDHHPCDDQPTPRCILTGSARPQAHSSLETPRPLTPRWTRLPAPAFVHANKKARTS